MSLQLSPQTFLTFINNQINALNSEINANITQLNQKIQIDNEIITDLKQQMEILNSQFKHVSGSFRYLNDSERTQNEVINNQINKNLIQIDEIIKSQNPLREKISELQSRLPNLQQQKTLLQIEVDSKQPVSIISASVEPKDNSSIQIPIEKKDDSITETKPQNNITPFLLVGGLILLFS